MTVTNVILVGRELMADKEEESEVDGDEVAWFLLTSSNLSRSAWGFLDKARRFMFFFFWHIHQAQCLHSTASKSERKLTFVEEGAILGNLRFFRVSFSTKSSSPKSLVCQLASLNSGEGTLVCPTGAVAWVGCTFPAHRPG